MMAKNTSTQDAGHMAVARALNLPVSTKHCIEICNSLRYKDISSAKQFLEEVAELKRAIPFKRFVRNIAHKAGMSSGRYPQKAAKEILRLLKSVEANAQVKGLDTSSLKITKILANKASIPFTGGRHRGATKRTHVEVEVIERKKKVAEKAAAKTEKKAEVKVMPAGVTKSEVEVMPVKSSHSVPSRRNAPNASEVGDVPTGTKEAPVMEKKAPAEPSSAELLRLAQQKAAELKKQEKEKKEVDEVSKLYGELQKKGSLRQGGKK